MVPVLIDRILKALAKYAISTYFIFKKEECDNFFQLMKMATTLNKLKEFGCQFKPWVIDID